MGRSKTTLFVQGTVLLVGQVTTIAEPVTVTVWLHVLLLPQQSVINQVRVLVSAQPPVLVVTVPRMLMV
jgi:hypothetical protein